LIPPSRRFPPHATPENSIVRSDAITKERISKTIIPPLSSFKIARYDEKPFDDARVSFPEAE